MREISEQCGSKPFKFLIEEAPTLARESPSTTTECETCALICPRESSEQTAAKPSLRPDAITLQASGIPSISLRD